MASIKKAFISNIWHKNPVSFQVLGICSALAVTVKLANSLVMGLALTAVVAGSNVVISLLRNLIPHRIRIIAQLAVISSLVIIVDQVLMAYYYSMSKQLSVFVGLIITNCIVMGRAEAFAMANKPLDSFWDGVSNGVGYAIVLALVGAVREIFGSGTILDIPIVPEGFFAAGYVNNSLMVFPPAAFVLLGIIIWVTKALGGALGKEI